MKTPRERSNNMSAKINSSAAVTIFLAKSAERDGTSAKLAVEYGITQKAVRDIWNLRTWVAATQPVWTLGDHERWATMPAHGRGLRHCTPALLSRAQCAAAAPAIQDWGPRVHDLPVPAANFLAPFYVHCDEIFEFFSPPRARPSGSPASALLSNPTNMKPVRHVGSFEDWAQRPRSSPMPLNGADMKMAVWSGWSSGPVLWTADYSPNPGWIWNDTSTARDATNVVKGAAIDFLPFTFEQSLQELSSRPLPPDFHMQDELADPRSSDETQHQHDTSLT